ncbi:hypothetical protein HDE_06494 [Halotydeus destructor]|nr:hypothetical protein HDE_06494 [Halotydeus destructor]
MRDLNDDVDSDLTLKKSLHSQVGPVMDKDLLSGNDAIDKFLLTNIRVATEYASNIREEIWEEKRRLRSAYQLIDEITIEKTECHFECADLTTQLNQAHRELSDYKRTSSTKLVKYEKEIKTLTALKRSLETQLTNFGECQKSIAKLRQEKARLIEDKQLIDQTVADVRQINALLIAQEKATLQSMENVRLESRSALAGSESMVRHLEMQIDDVYKPQITRYKETIKGLESCISKLKLKIADDIDKHISQTATRIDDEDSENPGIEYLGTRYVLESEVDALNRDVSEIKVQLDESHEENFILKEHLGDMESNMKELLSANDQLKNSLDGLKSNCSKLAEKFCPVCFVTLVDLEASGTPMMALSSCGHILCSECLEGQSRIKPACPMCQTGFQKSQSIKLFF